MGYFQNIIKNIGSVINRKSYFGILPFNKVKSSTQAWGASDFLNVTEKSLYVNKAIGKRAELVSGIEFILKDQKGNVLENNELYNLLYKPNDIFTGREFWKLWTKYYDIFGEVYIYVERQAGYAGNPGKVIGLHLLFPVSVNPKFNEFGKVIEYEYGSEKKYKPEEIIYTHNPDPRSPLRGVSLLKAGINAMKTEIDISTYQSKVLENGGRIEGVFKFKTDRLTQEQLAGVKDQYTKEYATAKKSGRPLFLGGDAEYIRTGLTPQELAFLDTKKMTLNDICILTEVPRSMLASTADVKYDNADAERTSFISETIKPLMITLTTALDERLIPKEQNLTFVDPTPENKDERRKDLETADKVHAMTINEKREKIGLDPVDDKKANEILIPFNLTTLSSQETATEKSIRKKGEEMEHPLKDPYIRDNYKKMYLKKFDKNERNFKNKLDEYIDGQLKRVLGRVDTQKGALKKDLMDDALMIELEVKIGKEQFMPFLMSIVEEAGMDSLVFAGSDYSFNITAEIASWVTNKADVFLHTINTTTLEQLKEAFTTSLSLGESRPQLVNRIRDVYGDIEKSRAETIARTEIHSANQYGNFQAYKQAGLNTKIWVSVGDEATRDSHLSIDGEERPIGIPFSNGLMYPGEVGAPAGEVINCRCTI